MIKRTALSLFAALAFIAAAQAQTVPPNAGIADPGNLAYMFAHKQDWPVPPSVLTGSTPSGVYAADVLAPGIRAVPGDQITVTIPAAGSNAAHGLTPRTPVTQLSNAILAISSTQVVSASVAAGGTGCTGPTATLTGTSTGFTAFTATAPVVGGAITNPVTLTSGGQYVTNPPALGNEPVTGSSCTGAALALTMGAAFVQPTFPGNYMPVPGVSATGTLATTTGSEVGLTLTLYFAPNAASVIPQSQLSGLSGAGNSWNTFQGYQALINNTTGNENTAFGWNACGAVTTGNQNTCFGVSALWGAQSTGNATGNVAVGVDSMRNSTVVSQSVAVGAQAGTNFGGASSVAVGFDALHNDTGAGGNTALGFNAGLNVSTGADNTLLGLGAGQSITQGNFNTCIGLACTATLTTGSKNIVIGNNNNHNCDTAAAATNQTFVLCADTGATPLLSGNIAAGALSLTDNGALIAGGGQPALSGSCTSLGSQSGGINAGAFRATCTTGQTVTLTMAISAPTSWACNAQDQSTAATLFAHTGAQSVNAVTFTASAATAGNDLISFQCQGY